MADTTRFNDGCSPAPGMGRASSVRDVAAAVQAEDAEPTRRLGLDPQMIGARLGGLLEAAADSDVGPAGDGRRLPGGALAGARVPDMPVGTRGVRGVPGRARRPRYREPLHDHRCPCGGSLGYELSAHLIRDHAFFGGPGTRYRLEPEAIATFLGLAPPAWSGGRRAVRCGQAAGASMKDSAAAARAGE